MNDDERKRVGLASGNWVHSDSNFEVENSQVNRQENVTPAHSKLGQKHQTRAKSEENSSSTRKLAASLPELKNMEISNHRYMEKIFQCLQKKLGRSAIDATFSMEAYKASVLIWSMFMASSMKAAIHLWSRFLDEFGNLQEHTKNSRIFGVYSTLLGRWQRNILKKF